MTTIKVLGFRFDSGNSIQAEIGMYSTLFYHLIVRFVSVQKLKTDKKFKTHTKEDRLFCYKEYLELRKQVINDLKERGIMVRSIALFDNNEKWLSNLYTTKQP
jgi:hypothetical protein